VKPFSAHEVRQFVGANSQAQPAGKYATKDLDRAVADLIADGHPEPRNRKEWGRLRASVRRALRRSRA
jgi:hypothetical protein